MKNLLLFFLISCLAACGPSQEEKAKTQKLKEIIKADDAERIPINYSDESAPSDTEISKKDTGQTAVPF